MEINIIEHRAGWCNSFNNFNERKLQNTLTAIETSFKRKNGIETDLRDYNGEIVISHDIASNQSPTLASVLDLYKKYNSDCLLAFNVKADGLQKIIKKTLTGYQIKNYFLFDMSVPDSLGYLAESLKIYVRDSEHEKKPKLTSPFIYGKATGVWLDSFDHKHLTNDYFTSILNYLMDGKKVCVVSPELHTWGKKEYIVRDYWVECSNTLKSVQPEIWSNFSICTDLPIQAKNYFMSI